MTTVLIDDSVEGKAFVELLRKMSFARVLTDTQENDWWNTISTAERQAIEEGLADVEAGRTFPHDEVMKRYEQWL